MSFTCAYPAAAIVYSSRPLNLCRERRPLWTLLQRVVIHRNMFPLCSSVALEVWRCHLQK